MAQRRMLSKKITDTDNFLDMPLSSQALYFHLNLAADDEGFIDKVKTIQRTIGASDDDTKLLIFKGFLIPFESGVVVIRHWRIHNYIQNDRFQPTIHQNEKSQIAYDSTKTANAKTCIQNGYNLDTQVRLGKDRLDKDRLDKDRLTNYTTDDEIPFKEIIEYLNHAANRNYKVGNSKTKNLIRARWNDGFNINDFKKVIDIKTKQWLGNADMTKYIRPETLFGTKFESYLNEVPSNNKSDDPNSDKFKGVFDE